jgi:hypothetical protein
MLWKLVKFGIVLVLAELLSLRVSVDLDHPSLQERFALEWAGCQQALADGTPNSCTLFGKIQIVEHFPDVKVQVVEHFPDLRVQRVEHFADSAGEWQIVEHFPDYKVQIVEHFPDIKIQWVDHFPGCD